MTMRLKVLTCKWSLTLKCNLPVIILSISGHLMLAISPISKFISGLRLDQLFNNITISFKTKIKHIGSIKLIVALEWHFNKFQLHHQIIIQQETSCFQKKNNRKCVRNSKWILQMNAVTKLTPTRSHLWTDITSVPHDHSTLWLLLTLYIKRKG